MRISKNAKNASMAKYNIVLTKTSQKQLDKLNEPLADSIIIAIEKLAYNPRPGGCKKLKGRSGYRIRVGDYRIIYEIIDHQLLITVIALGHRKDIYQ